MKIKISTSRCFKVNIPFIRFDYFCTLPNKFRGKHPGFTKLCLLQSVTSMVIFQIGQEKLLMSRFEGIYYNRGKKLSKDDINQCDDI